MSPTRRAPLLVGWLVGVLVFGVLTYVTSRWLFDEPDIALRSALTQTAFWSVCMLVWMRWTTRRANGSGTPRRDPDVQ